MKFGPRGTLKLREPRMEEVATVGGGFGFQDDPELLMEPDAPDQPDGPTYPNAWEADRIMEEATGEDCFCMTDTSHGSESVFCAAVEGGEGDG